MSVATDYHNLFLAQVERNQIRISRTLLLVLYVAHVCFPQFTPITLKFIHLQYPVGDNTDVYYDIGMEDVYYVINWVITLTFLRSYTMQYILSPLARYKFNIKLKKARVRFAEQGWCAIYYFTLFVFGAVLYWNLPYFMNLDNIYRGWPHFHMTKYFKVYYLMLMGFWIQQIFVLHIEAPRKDHWQMLSHHIITVALIITLYYYYFTRIGNLVLMIMDLVDVFLSAAKLLKYAGKRVACDVMFLVFMLLWITMRHGVYNYLYYHAWTRAQLLMLLSECIPGVVQKRCWDLKVVYMFLAMLGGLQVITLIWMYLIMKVAYKVITGLGAEDVRSDEDDTDDEAPVNNGKDTKKDL